MSPVEGVRIGPSDRSGKEGVTNETHRLRLGIDTITDAARRMAWRGETMDAETPNRNCLTMFRRLQLCHGGPPAEEIAILRSLIPVTARTTPAAHGDKFSSCL